MLLLPSLNWDYRRPSLFVAAGVVAAVEFVFQLAAVAAAAGAAVALVVALAVEWQLVVGPPAAIAVVVLHLHSCYSQLWCLVHWD